MSLSAQCSAHSSPPPRQTMTCCLDTGHPAVWLDTIYTSTLDTYLPALLHCTFGLSLDQCSAQFLSYTNIISSRLPCPAHVGCPLAAQCPALAGVVWRLQRPCQYGAAQHQPGPALPSRHRRSQDARKLRGGRHSAQQLAGDQRSSSSSSTCSVMSVVAASSRSCSVASGQAGAGDP